MKLLIFFIFFQVSIGFTSSGFVGFNSNVFASEVSDSYQARYEKWQLQQKNKSQRRPSSAFETKQVVNLKTQVSQLKLRPAVLTKTLPARVEPKIESSIKFSKAELDVESNVESKVVSKVNSVTTQDAAPTSNSLVDKMALDAREEFVNNIPKDNSQVQALLTMVDHTKVYFSINQNGALKELFKDDRFREIYTEDMTPPTRKLTYYFFKGYQDHQRNPNEPAQKSLNRNMTLNRERVESYLETTGIKSKLSRSLIGTYPAPTAKPQVDNTDESNNETNEVPEQDVTE